MVSSLFQIILGFSGLVGLVTKFIGPLTVAPTISLIGLSLFPSAGFFSGKFCCLMQNILSFNFQLLFLFLSIQLQPVSFIAFPPFAHLFINIPQDSQVMLVFTCLK